MSTSYNVSNFEATGDAYVGELFNIAHDGSAITLGDEPSVTLDTKDLNGDWSVNVIFKTSVITQQCILSIDDGSGGRYMDIMHVDGDKCVLYYEGVETPITYTTESLPYEEWVHVGFGYDLSENKLSFSVDGVYVDIAPTTAPTVPPGRLFRWFRPVHVDDFYFNGIIDTYRISSVYQWLTLTHDSAFVFYSKSQAGRWMVSSTVWAAAFSDSYVTTKISTVGNSTSTSYHGFCNYDGRFIMCQNKSGKGEIQTIQTGGDTARRVLSNTRSLGMHYFERNSLLIFVNAGDYTLNSKYVGDNDTTTVNIVSSDGTYKNCRGEIHDRYMFGSKLAADGTTHQIFRTDHEGLNEITVDCLTLLGVNSYVENYACNKDDDLVYFGHPSSRLLHSIDMNLENLTAYTLVLNSGVDSDIEYSDGWLYYANLSPLSTEDNDSLWRWNIDTDELQKFTTGVDLSGSHGQQTLFVDRANNHLVVCGYKLYNITSTEIDFSIPGMKKGLQTSSSIDLSWEPIDSAIGYKILQNGLVIDSTSSTSLSVTGLDVDTDYKFTLQYTTDGVTFSTNRFYNAFFHTSSTAYHFPLLPALFEIPSISWGVGFSDPYTANELFLGSGNYLYKYDLSENTLTLLRDIRMGYGYPINRMWHNKSVYFKYGTVVYDAGIDIEKRRSVLGVYDFMGDPENVVFDHEIVSGGDTAQVYGFTSTLDGSNIYYSTHDEDLFVYDVSAKTSTRIYEGDGTSNTRSLRIDPLDQNSMIFVDNSTLKRIDLTTYAVTEIKTSISAAHLFYVIGGVVHGCHWYGSYFKINVDGTGYEEIIRAGFNFNAMFVDTINKRVLLFDDGYTCKVVPDSTIPDLPSDPSTITFVVHPRPISLDMVWKEVDGATGYTVKYAAGAGVLGECSTVITSTEFTENLSHSIGNLQSDTEYTVYLYYSIDTSTPTILLGSGTYSTLENLPGNYDSSSFANKERGGAFDLTSLSPKSLQMLAGAMNDLFDTGAEIYIKVGPNSTKSTKAKFVKRGETTSVEGGGSSIAIPFNTSSGSGQDATLKLSDNTSVVVEYDETTEAITIGGNTYASGQSLVLDGQKVTIYTV